MSKESRARWSVAHQPRAEQLVQDARALGLLAARLVNSRRERVDAIQAVAGQAAAAAATVSSCKAGCASCCKAGPFQVIPDEVDILAPHVSSAAWDRVRALAGLDQDEAERRDCPLLDPASRTCSVYAHRPVICRTYLVTSPASECETAGTVKINGDAAVFTMQFAQRLFPANPFTGILWRELLARVP